LNQFKVILLVLETQEFILLLVFGVIDLCFYGLELSNQILKTIISILHLPLLQGYALLKLDDTMVGLSERILVKLKVIIRHLTLFLNVLILQLLKVGANLTKVINNREHLRLRRIKLILELANRVGSLLLGLVLGFGVKFAGSGFSISNALNCCLVDLRNSLFF